MLCHVLPDKNKLMKMLVDPGFLQRFSDANGCDYDFTTLSTNACFKKSIFQIF